MNIYVLAIVSGILYFLGTSRVGYGATSIIGPPVMLGGIYGLLYGDLVAGLQIGASINLLYLGQVATGGNIPSDSALAGVIAIPVALQLGLDANTAVSIAVPFGILGVFLDQIRRTTNLIWLHKADAFALEGNDKGIYRCAIVYPTILAFFLRFVPVFVVNLFGAEAVQYLLEYLPQFIVTGLAVAGGILPALGFALIIMSIGRNDLLPYFFIGFFLIKYLHINTMAVAVFGLALAALIYFNDVKKGEEVYE